MAKKVAIPKFVPPAEVEVTYDLDRLPSAQHKAGLAGLLLQIESMTERQRAEQLPADWAIPEVINQTSTTATVRFTTRSVQSLFDDLYDADVADSASPSKKDRKKNFEKRIVTPSGKFFTNYTEGGKELWHKLWRDMLFAVPKKQFKTRQAYRDRSEGKPTKEGLKAWKNLVDYYKALTQGTLARCDLSGSLMLAVQECTAEVVPFEDRVEDQLLLHFWTLTTRVFVPQVLDAEGKGSFVGYALMIPEVTDLGRFIWAYKWLLKNLGSERSGYRPRGAVIAVPEQGALEFLENLDRLAAEQVLKERPSRYLAGVEFYYMVDVDNKNRKLKNVKLKSHGRIPITLGLLERYGNIRRSFYNQIFLAGVLLALLRDEPWFVALKTFLHEREWSFFVHCTQGRRRTPSAMIGFAWEVDLFFKQQSDRRRVQVTAAAEDVDEIVYEIVRVSTKVLACARAGLKETDPEWWYKAAEERRHVCSKLYLEFRSRKGDEFVEHFSYRFAAASQWLDLDKYLLVSRALMNLYPDPDPKRDGRDRPRTRDDIKMLTLLALSAHSRSIRKKDMIDLTALEKEISE